MAYSDYGGYAFRNGERVEDRSDFVLTPDGGFGTPGSYPGFAMIAAGINPKPLLDNPMSHACLGDGPLFVGLYKQFGVNPYLIKDGAIESFDLLDCEHSIAGDRIETYKGDRYIDYPYAFTDDDEPTTCSSRARTQRRRRRRRYLNLAQRSCSRAQPGI